MGWLAGVDVSKEQLHVALRVEGREGVVDSFTVPNTEGGWETLRDRLPDPVSEGIVGLEATGGYEKGCRSWLHRETDVSTVVLNPHRVKAFAQSKGLRTKTDAVDAGTIVHYMDTHRPEPSGDPDSARSRLRELTRHLEHLKDRRAQEKTYKESVEDEALEETIEATIETYDRQIERIKQLIQEHLDEHPELQDRVAFMVSITGLGDETAPALLAEMKDPLDPTTLDPKAEVAHSGLAPEHRQSGTSLKTASMSRRGNARIRKLLYYPTLAAIRHNPVIKAFYEKLIGRGKAKMVAVVACMRKMLHLVVGVLKNQTEFDPQWQQKRA